MKKISNNLLILFAVLTMFNSCKKEYDLPPVKSAAEANKINIANIKAKFKTNLSYKFKADSSLYCVVTADEVSGNLYKDIFVKDATGALHVKLINSGGLFIGDSIRINIKGATLNDYNDLVQLDSVDSEKNIVKLASGYNPTPMVTTIANILANTSATSSIQSRLVQLNNVEFVSADQNQPFADAIGKASLNRILKSCDGKTLTVRTSGYSNFAARLTPGGNGTFIGIVSNFNGTMQMLVRNANELIMNGTLCGGGTNTNTAGTYLSKNFDDNSTTSGGWTKQNVSGTIDWTTATFGGQTFAKISNFVSSANVPCETWLISPAINLSSSTAPMLSFNNAYKFTGDALEAYVSTNYTSGLPSTATWTKVNFTLSSGNYVFVSSGLIPLSAYKSATTRIAFKYKGTAADGSTWEIDDVLVKEN
ncbi:MAG: choice-of-anchor J domain-containing protein [Bacteroidia bacterium]|nr:choice-of-anchor J domain-containing protein [Bacteroidia bacterium]